MGNGRCSVCELKYTSHFDIDTLTVKLHIQSCKKWQNTNTRKWNAYYVCSHTVDRFTQTSPEQLYTATVTVNGGHFRYIFKQRKTNTR